MNLPITFLTANADLSSYAVEGSRYIVGQCTHKKTFPTTVRSIDRRDVRNTFSSDYYKGAQHHAR